MQTLLIVDDDPAIREMFSTLLTDEGYKVLSAAGGTECLDHLSRTTPDLIILDIMMHPVDGWETLELIRKNPATTDIPVIMFSGKSPSCKEIIQYGGWVEGYLMKPLGLMMITESLEAVFERCRTDTAARQHYLENGADPGLVRELFQTRRLLSIQDKFPSELKQDPRGSGPVAQCQKARYEELYKILDAAGADKKNRPGSAADMMI